MRWWRLPDGSLLAERPCARPGPGRLLDAEGQEVSLQRAWHQLRDGALVRSFEPSVSSVEDALYHQGYRVQGGALVEHLQIDQDSGVRARALRRLEGLTPMQETPPDAALDALLAAREASRRQARDLTRQEDDARRASFRAALRRLGAAQPLTLRLGEGGAKEVVDAGGTPVWRDTTWRWRGGELHRALQGVLREVWGAEGSLAAQVETDGEWLWYHGMD
ncbi:MAG: hypothetical protein H6741_28860 [Alphaproteobacteria bacterium]|nr:hypothetical protein [Alphaproteobacteria bacterium]